MDYGVAEPIERAMRRLTEEAAYGYEPPNRPAALAEAFAAHMRERFGWAVSAERVVPVADLVQALFTLVSVFSERGQGVVLQTPIYPRFPSTRCEKTVAALWFIGWWTTANASWSTWSLCRACSLRPTSR